MRLVRSPLFDGPPAIRHGFSTRRGGVSVGRYESLNLGAKWGDDAAAVAENRRRLAADGGFDLAGLTTARQVHGATCLVTDGEPPAALASREADALVTSEPGRAVSVFTADCAPILLCDGEGRVGAAHAGWRGTIARVAEAAVEALVGLGADRARIRAAIGPCIGPCCFEVGEEVAAPFERLDPASVRRPRERGPRAKPHVDLASANRTVLVQAGIAPARIDAVPHCTMCRADLYFSFRRDGAGIGQMLSFVVADGAAGAGAG